jgi:hypothetical protein
VSSHQKYRQSSPQQHPGRQVHDDHGRSYPLAATWFWTSYSNRGSAVRRPVPMRDTASLALGATKIDFGSSACARLHRPPGPPLLVIFYPGCATRVGRSRATPSPLGCQKHRLDPLSLLALRVSGCEGLCGPRSWAGTSSSISCRRTSLIAGAFQLRRSRHSCQRRLRLGNHPRDDLRSRQHLMDAAGALTRRRHDLVHVSCLDRCLQDVEEALGIPAR